MIKPSFGMRSRLAEIASRLSITRILEFHQMAKSITAHNSYMIIEIGLRFFLYKIKDKKDHFIVGLLY